MHSSRNLASSSEGRSPNRLKKRGVSHGSIANATTHAPTKMSVLTVQPRNGTVKPTIPNPDVSFQLFLITAGSSSAPARKVRSTAPVEDRKRIHDWSVPSAALPMSAPRKSWATYQSQSRTCRWRYGARWTAGSRPVPSRATTLRVQKSRSSRIPAGSFGHVTRRR